MGRRSYLLETRLAVLLGSLALQVAPPKSEGANGRA